jgi:Fe-S oxidoreductase
MRHIITAPLNIFTASLTPTGARLKPINFETTEKFGINALADFTWKERLDFDACTECGRCTEVCPANIVGKELSPRDIILDLRDLMHGKGVGKQVNEELKPDSVSQPASAALSHFALPIIGTLPATAPEALWQCTTCGACMETCPVFIEQMPKIVEMRRFQVMEEADFPDKMQEAVTSLETRGHPFRGTQATRTDWSENLQIKSLADFEKAEIAELDVLLWVGCGGALIERNQKVTQATAELLTQAGVKFAVLGREEKCNGDVARRIGNEFLFAQLAEENIEKLNSYGIKKVLTACPHCFNTFKNEYPQFGGHYEVVHHSEYLADLVKQGKIKATPETTEKIALHDPCYLGRHNGVFDAPRELVQISSRSKPVELERSREKSFCCGGGGGLSFVDEPPDKRVNQERAREFLESGADTLAVGCPFCLTMMEDGVNARKGERDVRVQDVAEILLEASKTEH